MGANSKIPISLTTEVPSRPVWSRRLSARSGAITSGATGCGASWSITGAFSANADKRYATRARGVSFFSGR